MDIDTTISTFVVWKLKGHRLGSATLSIGDLGPSGVARWDLRARWAVTHGVLKFNVDISIRRDIIIRGRKGIRASTGERRSRGIRNGARDTFSTERIGSPLVQWQASLSGGSVLARKSLEGERAVRTEWASWEIIECPPRFLLRITLIVCVLRAAEWWSLSPIRKLNLY